jgi:glucose-6-phosphate 1-epimerase
MLVGAGSPRPPLDFMSVDQLNHRFAIGDQLRFELDPHGMERAVIHTELAKAIIYVNGAHVTHYQRIGERPILFLSSKSNWAPGRAIRGGIPIIYPWFGPKKDDPNARIHGFARTSQWRVEKSAIGNSFVELTFALDVPQHSNLRYVVRIGKALEMQLQVHNDYATPLTFEEALHTYLAVSHVRLVFVQGLRGRCFIDKTDEMRRKTDADDLLGVGAETDRVYVNAPDGCKLFDLPWKRCIHITKSNSSTTVVWNPWSEKTKTLPDLGNDEWPRMLCIETANAADNAITLAPGQTHQMSAAIRTEKLVTSPQSPSSSPQSSTPTPSH